MQIFVDTREKQHAITRIIAEFDKQGIQHFSTKLFCGDYQSLDNPRLVIDRKQNLNEVAGNVCQDHKRFVAELERANDAGIHIIILVEHGRDIKTLEDVVWWENPRIKESPKAVNGVKLYKIMKTISDKYGCEWKFCTKAQTGAEIVRLLS